jgi:hypothetical protein
MIISTPLILLGGPKFEVAGDTLSKVGINFANKRWLLGQYSSLADPGLGI